ncbi:hypothetical protein CA54_10490 [Symmachiella macrocystis]|uniref:Uncharacterized protein n=1 Tax=Symmachiella macrocystis TaxID=2527985 RepID=A0A5C6BLP3_9PLAN|nr:hypothetical protein [Symmachiella macrocystis]TWU12226.1 hypothetical protein CA54_10490 [Symmachiella macrocystis]
MPAPSRRSQIVAFILLLGAAFAGQDVLAAEQSARLKNGAVIRGELRGKTPDTLFFSSATDAPPVPLSHIQSISNQRPISTVTARGALRRITLVSGESFSGEIVQWSAASVGIRLAGDDQVCTIPTETVAAIFQPQGTVNLLYEDFEKEPLQWPPTENPQRDPQLSRSGKFSLLISSAAAPLLYKLPTPLSAGQIELSFHDYSSRDAGSNWIVEFRFETQLGERVLRAEIGPSQETYALKAPLGPRFSHQQLRRTAGWHDLRVQFDSLDTMVLIDSAVLASGPAMKGVLKSMRILPHKKAAANAQLRIDDLRITRFVASQLTELRAKTQDVLIMATGDEIFGTIVQVDATQVRIQGKFGAVDIPWSELRGLLRRESEPTFPAVSGAAVRIQIREASAIPHAPSEFLTVALESATADGVTWTHPLLGRQTWPWKRIQKIEPMFVGKYQLLFPGIRHLGDELRPQFRRPHPSSDPLSVTFALDELPASPVFVSLNVAQLEPAGPQTPPGRPFLDELRAGHLGTYLSINGHPQVSLNERIDFRTDVDKPDRLRVPIPVEALQVGKNVIEIRQRPSTRDATDFDDCEVSHIALEIELPDNEQ